jgi:hypothetical protein
VTDQEPERVDKPGTAGGDLASTAVLNRIRSAMAYQRISAGRLAARMNHEHYAGPIPEVWVHRRMQGRVKLTFDDVQWIAAALEVPMSSLLEDL